MTEIDTIMMNRDEQILSLGKELIARGMGLYGREAITRLAYNVGLAFLDDDSVEWLDSDPTTRETVIRNFLVEYSKINLPAKMTAIVYARKYRIELPDSVRKKKTRRTRLKKWFTK